MRRHREFKPKTMVVFMNDHSLAKGTLAEVVSYDSYDETYLVKCLSGQWTGETHWVYGKDMTKLAEDGI